MPSVILDLKQRLLWSSLLLLSSRTVLALLVYLRLTGRVSTGRSSHDKYFGIWAPQASDENIQHEIGLMCFDNYIENSRRYWCLTLTAILHRILLQNLKDRYFDFAVSQNQVNDSELMQERNLTKFTGFLSSCFIKLLKTICTVYERKQNYFHMHTSNHHAPTTSHVSSLHWVGSGFIRGLNFSPAFGVSSIPPF